MLLAILTGKHERPGLYMLISSILSFLFNLSLVESKVVRPLVLICYDMPHSLKEFLDLLCGKMGMLSAFY